MRRLLDQAITELLAAVDRLVIAAEETLSGENTRPCRKVSCALLRMNAGSAENACCETSIGGECHRLQASPPWLMHVRSCCTGRYDFGVVDPKNGSFSVAFRGW